MIPPPPSSTLFPYTTLFRSDEVPQLLIRRRVALLHALEQLHQLIERILVAGEENLLLVLEVVIEVALLHVQRRGNLLDRRSEEHTSELQSLRHLVCRLLLEK